MIAFPADERLDEKAGLVAPCEAQTVTLIYTQEKHDKQKLHILQASGANASPKAGTFSGW